MADHWTFLTNHAHVLHCVARDPGMRLRDMADCVGITERTAHRIVCELEASGYLTRHRNGARNTYEVHPDVPVSGATEHQVAIDQIVSFLIEDARAGQGV
jgi:DNA-binding IclR family transcriptional regulator